MSWALRYSETAEKQLSKLDKGIAREVKKYLADLCKLQDPAARGHSLGGPMAGLHRYRLGQLRVIVEIDWRVILVTVVRIDRRDSIY